jgi:hypothetical protein
VGWFDPFQRTIDAETKFLPVTVSVKPAEPAAALSGLIEVTEGSGYEVFPIPLKPMMCGLPGALFRMVSVPLRFPCSVGVNVRVMVHVARVAILEPQFIGLGEISGYGDTADGNGSARIVGQSHGP